MINPFGGVFVVSTIVLAQGQQPASNPSTSTSADPQVRIASTKAPAVPPFLSLSGVLMDSSGQRLVGPVEITLAVYLEREGGAALWSEVQTVQAEPKRPGREFSKK